MSSEAGEHEGKGHASHGPPHHGGGGHEEHEGAPEWLISFADNVMLQMGFFVILLALNMGPKATQETEGDGDKAGANVQENMLDFAIAMRQAFNNSVDPRSSSPADQALIQRMRDREGQGDSKRPGPAGKERDVDAPRPSEYYTPGGVIQFAHQSSALTPDGRQITADLAPKFRGTRWVIEVRGHASSWETFRDPRKSMALSHERAMAVASVLVENGVGWNQIRIVACGDSEPVVAPSHDVTENYINERVEIIQTRETLRQSAGPAETGSRPAGGAGGGAPWDSGP